MPVFKLNFEQFITLCQRIDSLEGLTKEPIFPLFYFVSQYVFIYKLFDGYIFCTIVEPEDAEQFKTRYLSKAYELIENYLESYTYKPNIIPQENPNE